MPPFSASRLSARLDRVRAALKPVSTPWRVAAALGAVIGLTAGGAYLGGSVARQATLDGEATRIEGVTTAAAKAETPAAIGAGAREGGVRRARLAATPGVKPFRLGTTNSSRDLDCLTQAVYYEARGEGSDGMKAVAQVVLNRARHPAFPKSVCSVVFQGSNRGRGCQFSFTCNGAMRARVNQAAWSRARRVATAALSGSVFRPVGTATHFHTTAVSPRWGGLVRIGQVGQHVFYRFGGRGGSSASFRQAAEPSRPAEGQPTMVMASLDPTETVRQAGQAIAYTVVLAREGLTPAEVRDGARAEIAEATLQTVKGQPSANPAAISPPTPLITPEALPAA